MYIPLKERFKSKKSLIAVFILTFVITLALATIASTILSALSPEYYSVITLNKKKRYLIEKGDNMVGKGIPNSKIKITIGNKKHQEVFYTQTNSKGEWFYKLPNTLKSGKYSSRVENLDSKSIKAFSKTYRVRLASSKGLYKFQSWFKNAFKFGGMTAFAQDEGEATPEESPSEEPTAIPDYSPEAVPVVQSGLQPGMRGYCEGGYRFIGSDNGDDASDNNQWVPDESCGQVSAIPYNLAITDIGFVSGGDVLTPGGVFAPTVVVSDQNSQYVTDDSGMNVEWEIVSQDLTQRFQIAKEYECPGLQVCYLRVPQELSPGEYFLQAYLYTPHWNEAIPGVPVAVSVRSELQAQPYEQLSLDDSEVRLENGPCLGSVCSGQNNAKVIPIDDLYMLDPKYDSSDGTAYNIVADCGEGCSVPGNVISTRYLQNEINLNELVPEYSGGTNGEDLLNCLRESQGNPASILSMIAALASLDEAFSSSLGLNSTATELTSKLYSTDFMVCSLYDTGTDIVDRFSKQFGLFQSVEMYNEPDFGSVESFYKQSKTPLLVQSKFNDSLHMGIIIAVSDNYVWYMDPLDPNTSNSVLRIHKDDFRNSYYNGVFWRMYPYELLASMQRNPIGDDVYSVGAGPDAAPDAEGPRTGRFLGMGQIFVNEKEGMREMMIYPTDKDWNLIGGAKVLRTDKARIHVTGNTWPDYVYLGYLGQDDDKTQNDQNYYKIPINQMSWVDGNFLPVDLSAWKREEWVGVRINRVYSHHSPQSTEKYVQDLNRLGVGYVRISVEDASAAEIEQKMPLLTMAKQNNYTVILTVKPNHRFGSYLQSRIADVMTAVKNAGFNPNEVIFELGNEFNLCQYWQDFEMLSGTDGRSLSITDPRGALQAKYDQASNDNMNGEGGFKDDPCKVFGSVIGTPRRDKAFAIFIKETSDEIWKYGTNIRVMVGARASQGGDPSAQPREMAEFTKALESNGANIAKLDFAFHGYDVLQDGEDGIIPAYNLYKNDPIIQKYKFGQTGWLWMTEAGLGINYFDPLDWVTILEWVKKTIKADRLINAIIIHEFDGVTENKDKLWQLRDGDTGVKLPNYGVLQFYLTHFDHNIN